MAFKSAPHLFASAENLPRRERELKIAEPSWSWDASSRLRGSSTAIGPGSTEQVALVPVTDEIKIIISFIFYNPVSCEPWEVFDATHKRYVLQQKRFKYITTDGGRASCEPSAAQFWPYWFSFIEEVMLAEENKNPGPSALDGKSTGIFVFLLS